MKKETNGGGPLSKRAARTRENILAAAVEEFSLRGFDGTRVAAVAARAGTNKERIYAYFGKKEALFSAVLERVYSLVVAEDEAVLAMGDGVLENLTERLLRRYFSFHAEHPEFRRLLAWANLMEGDHGTFIRERRSEAFEHLSGLYRKGQEKGFLPERVSFKTYLFALSGLSYFYYSNKRTMKETLGVDLDDPAVAETFLRELPLLL